MAASPDAILHLAVLHALAQAGFASTSRAASLTLSSTLARYFGLVASSCAERAALGGRSKVTAVDVIRTFEDLSVGDIGELQEWAVNLDNEVSFTGSKMDELARYLRGGLSIDDSISMDYIQVEDEGSGEDDDDHKEILVDGNVGTIDDSKEFSGYDRTYTPRSPPLSWLPSMPSEQPQPSLLGHVIVDNILAPQTIGERYRRPVTYASSQIAQADQQVETPSQPDSIDLSSVATSFPALLTTYSSTVGEPSVALRQTDGRRQTADLLRLNVANPEAFSPTDSLSQHVTALQVSPIVPSHSDTLSTKLLPINPNTSDIVSSLLHKIRSPYLPSQLRDRLTSLRPPQAQSSDHNHFLYGEPMRGADEAALARARGKVTGDEHVAWVRATWDSGPHGIDRWSRGRLPSGRKVVKTGQGETAPRESEGAKRLRLKMSAAGIVDTRDQSPGPVAVPASTPGSGIKLRLGGPRTVSDSTWAAEAPTIKEEPGIVTEVTPSTFSDAAVRVEE